MLSFVDILGSGFYRIELLNINMGREVAGLDRVVWHHPAIVKINSTDVGSGPIVCWGLPTILRIATLSRLIFLQKDLGVFSGPGSIHHVGWVPVLVSTWAVDHSRFDNRMEGWFYFEIGISALIILSLNSGLIFSLPTSEYQHEGVHIFAIPQSSCNTTPSSSEAPLVRSLLLASLSCKKKKLLLLCHFYCKTFGFVSRALWCLSILDCRYI